MASGPAVVSCAGDGCVIASAGGGKTTSNVSMHVSAESRGTRTLVVTFTNATVADYIARANRAAEGLASLDNVLTFHKLAHKVLGTDSGATCTDTVVATAVEELVRAARRVRGRPPDPRRRGAGL
jgi:superfamily I DNA/RNA helicase